MPASDARRVTTVRSPAVVRRVVLAVARRSFRSPRRRLVVATPHPVRLEPTSGRVDRPRAGPHISTRTDALTLSG